MGARERLSVKPKLKADKINHKIIIDEVTTLTEIPPLAWEYKLGNPSALEWILDQYIELIVGFRCRVLGVRLKN